METFLRLHWLGKNKIAAETNAAYVMTIWNLPQSRALENQTLNKLAQAPWRSFSSASNPPASGYSINNSQNPLRPLLDDLVQQEFYLEARCATNKQIEAALAIRLDDTRASLWMANFALILESFGGSRIQDSQNSKSSSRWHLQFTNHVPPASVEAEIARNGEWIIIGAGSERCTIVTDFLNQVQKNGAPVAPTNSWLEAEFNPRQISPSLDGPIPEWLPKISLTINSEGNDVRTVGQFTFSKPLDLALAPWNVPTNLIDGPLSQFTAIRGIAPLPFLSNAWSTVDTDSPPNQLYLWAQGTAPMLTFCAAPVPNASNAVYTLAEHATTEGNLWMKTNGSLGRFVRPANTNALQWINVPFLEPHLEPVSGSAGDFLMLSFGPRALTNHAFPDALLAQFVGSSNLVYYSWEMSHNEVEPSLFIGQFLRFALHKAQVPPESIGVHWLQTLGSILGNCGTQITLTQPDQLTLVRRSTIGFSSIELQLLVDWLESPTFPVGLNTFVTPPPPLITHELRTNSPAKIPRKQGTNPPVQPHP